MFVKYKSKQKRGIELSESVTFRIFKYKPNWGPTVVIKIGSEVAEKINLSFEKRVQVFVDSENPRKWLVKKTDDPLNSFKFSRTSFNRKIYLGSVSFILSLEKNPLFVLKEEDSITHEIQYEITEDGLVLFID